MVLLPVPDAMVADLRGGENENGSTGIILTSIKYRSSCVIKNRKYKYYLINIFSNTVSSGSKIFLNFVIL